MTDKIHLLTGIDSLSHVTYYEAYSTKDLAEKALKEVETYEASKPFYCDHAPWDEYAKRFILWLDAHPLNNGHSTPCHTRKYNIKEFDLITGENNEN